MTTNETINQLQSLLQADDAFSEEQRDLLLRFGRAVLQTNETMNLTAITDAEGFYGKHILDSLSLLPLLDACGSAGKNLSVLDVGSGAGFPGIPLKIMRPTIEMTLLDSLLKRVNFLNQTIQDLELKEIQAVHGRAEDMARQKSYRDSFDVVTARAVASLPTLLELCLPFVKVGGVFLAMKGSKDEWKEAAKALALLGGEAAGEENLVLPFGLGERVILKIRKKKPTLPVYPRKAGIPGKKPLI